MPADPPPDAVLAAPRRNGSRWQKGQSGNPGGRRARPAELQEALEAASPAAVSRLVALLACGDPRVELRAAEAILARTLAPAPAAPAVVPVEPAERVQAIEARMVADALSGDRQAAAIVLAALDPTRYATGARATAANEGDGLVDTVDFIPLVMGERVA